MEEIKSIATMTEHDARFMKVEFTNGNILEMNMAFIPELYGIDLLSDEGQNELLDIMSDVMDGTYV